MKPASCPTFLGNVLYGHALDLTTVNSVPEPPPGKLAAGPQCPQQPVPRSPRDEDARHKVTAAETSTRQGTGTGKDQRCRGRRWLCPGSPTSSNCEETCTPPRGRAGLTPWPFSLSSFPPLYLQLLSTLAGGTPTKDPTKWGPRPQEEDGVLTNPRGDGCHLTASHGRPLISGRRLRRQ